MRAASRARKATKPATAKPGPQASCVSAKATAVRNDSIIENYGPECKSVLLRLDVCSADDVPPRVQNSPAFGAARSDRLHLRILIFRCGWAQPTVPTRRSTGPSHEAWAPTGSSIAFKVHRVVANRTGFRGVLPLVRGLCGDRDHVALGQVMTDPALDTRPARLTGSGCLRVDHLAAGDELRFAIHDDEHVVGVVVHLGAALHAAIGNDDQTFILDDAPALDESGRNLVVVDVVDARRETGGDSKGCQGGNRQYRGECEQ